MSERLEKGIWA